MDPDQTPSEYEARWQTANFSYILLRTTKEMLCVRARAFPVNKCSFKNRCSLYTGIAVS